MVVTCPYCGAQLHNDPLAPLGAGATISGARACRSCGKTFELYVIERPYQAIVPQRAQSAGLQPAVAPPLMPQPAPVWAAPIAPPVAPPIPSPLPEPIKPPPQLPLLIQPVPHSLQPITPEMIAASACANHPNNQAVTACAHCRRFICNLCDTIVAGQNYCPQCFEALHARGALATSQQAFQTPSTALALAVASVLIGWVYCLGLLLGPAAIYFSVRALNEIQERPGLPGRGKAIAAIVLSVFGMLLSLAFMGLIVLGTAAQQLGK